MSSVLLANDPDRLSVILPAIDRREFRATVADLGDPALDIGDFDCVVPFTLDDYGHLRRRPDLHRINCLMPQSALVEILDDKYRCNRLLMALGFGGNIPAMDARATSWPIIYKKKQDSTGRHSFLCFCEADLRILLCHFPRVFDTLPPDSFDLVLAGHMHDGQISLPLPRDKLRLAHMRARFTTGLYRRGGMWMHVSPGLGTTFVPFRFYARPEATELVLQPA